MSSFNCLNCSAVVSLSSIGTRNRNHCPICLWSKHVDLKTPGDRKSDCHSGMQPIGLVFKDKKIDKYSGKVSGELMLIHLCTKCKSISPNRIAGDDNTEKIIKLLTKQSQYDEVVKNTIVSNNLNLLNIKDKKEVETVLFGFKE